MPAPKPILSSMTALSGMRGRVSPLFGVFSNWTTREESKKGLPCLWCETMNQIFWNQDQAKYWTVGPSSVNMCLDSDVRLNIRLLRFASSCFLLLPIPAFVACWIKGLIILISKDLLQADAGTNSCICSMMCQDYTSTWHIILHRVRW